MLLPKCFFLSFRIKILVLFFYKIGMWSWPLSSPVSESMEMPFGPCKFRLRQQQNFSGRTFLDQNLLPWEVSITQLWRVCMSEKEIKVQTLDLGTFHQVTWKGTALFSHGTANRACRDSLS